MSAFFATFLRRLVPCACYCLTLGSLAAREFVIPANQTVINGAELGVEPGDTILLATGRRTHLEITHVTGSRDAYVTIRNQDGPVEILSPEGHNLRVAYSRYFHLTGTGNPALRYGIHLLGAGAHLDSNVKHGSGVNVVGLSSDYEIDHIEIEHPGFAGMLLKTDGAIGAIMDNVNLHHNYIHDTGAEGIYLGETQPTGQLLHHIKVWNNLIVRTGWEACQIANSYEDVEVHNNVFYHAGLEKLLWQDNNFQLSANATCHFHHNIVIGATSHLVIAFGGFAKKIEHNYFEGTVTGPAVSLWDSNIPFLPNTTITLTNNFFRDIQPVQPIILFVGEKSILRVENNTWEGGNAMVRFQPIIDLSQVVLVKDNRNVPVTSPRFVDAAHDNFQLAPDDPYRKLGVGLLPE